MSSGEAKSWQAKGIKPITRALRYCQKQGWEADRVDRRIGPKDSDFLGCIDMAAVAGREWSVQGGDTWSEEFLRLTLIQVTSDSNHAARRAKVLDHADRLRPFVQAGCVVEVWSFGLKGRGDDKKMSLRRERVEIE